MIKSLLTNPKVVNTIDHVKQLITEGVNIRKESIAFDEFRNSISEVCVDEYDTIYNPDGDYIGESLMLYGIINLNFDINKFCDVIDTWTMWIKTYKDGLGLKVSNNGMIGVCKLSERPDVTIGLHLEFAPNYITGEPMIFIGFEHGFYGDKPRSITSDFRSCWWKPCACMDEATLYLPRDKWSIYFEKYDFYPTGVPMIHYQETLHVSNFSDNKSYYLPIAELDKLPSIIQKIRSHVDSLGLYNLTEFHQDDWK